MTILQLRTKMPQKKCHISTESQFLREPDYYITANGLPNILDKNNFQRKHRLKYTNFQQNLLSNKLLSKRQRNGSNVISICGSKEDSNKMIELSNDNNCSNVTNRDSNIKIVSQEIENVSNDKQTKDIYNQKIKNMLDFECDLNSSNR